jgi:uncharacterized cupin superfamily protein
MQTTEKEAQMRKIVVFTIILASIAVIVLASRHEETNAVVLPVKVSKEEMAGKIFDRPEMVEMERYGTATQDVMTLLSSDKKFASGVYKAGKHRAEWTVEDGYGVDEFLYMLDGTMTLTSVDGSVQEFGPGDAVTIPMEWAGVEESDGYTQLWVIYSVDGSGLE